MLIKTPEFVKLLNSRIYQYTFNRNAPPFLHGSFKNAKYVFDIDYVAFVTFNQKFIDILLNKLNRLKDFKFLYLNAGSDKRFEAPWKIFEHGGCNFDLVTVRKWLDNLKSRNLIPNDEIKIIESKLNKK